MATTGTDLLKGLAMTLSASENEAERRHEKEIKSLELAFDQKNSENNMLIQLHHQDYNDAKSRLRETNNSLNKLKAENDFVNFATQSLPEQESTSGVAKITRSINEPLVDFMERRAENAINEANEAGDRYDSVIDNANKYKQIYSKSLGMVNHMSDSVEGISAEDLRNSLYNYAVKEGIGEYQKGGLKNLDLSEEIEFDNGFKASPDSADVGLFQLNTFYQGTVDQQKKVWGKYINPQEMSESENISYAMRLAKQEGWDNWAAYNNKNHEQFLEWTDQEYLDAGVSQRNLNIIEAEAVSQGLDPSIAKAVMMAESGGDHSSYLLNFSKDKRDKGAKLQSGNREHVQGKYLNATTGLMKMADHLITNKLAEELEVTRQKNLPYTDKTKLFGAKLDELDVALGKALESTSGVVENLVNGVLVSAEDLSTIKSNMEKPYEELNNEQKLEIDAAENLVHSERVKMIAPFLSQEHRDILDAGETNENYGKVLNYVNKVSNVIIDQYHTYSEGQNKVALGSILNVLSEMAVSNGMDWQDISAKLGFFDENDMKSNILGIQKLEEGRSQHLLMQLGMNPEESFSFDVDASDKDIHTVLDAFEDTEDLGLDLNIEDTGLDLNIELDAEEESGVGTSGLNFEEEDVFEDAAFKFTPAGEEFDPSFLTSGERWSYTLDGEKTDENYVVNFREDLRKLYTPSKITKVEALNELNSLLDQGGFTMASLMKELNDLSFSDKRKFLNQYADQVGIDPGESKRTLKAWDELGSGAVGRTLGFMNRADINESITNIESIKDFEATKDLIITFAKLKGVDIAESNADPSFNIHPMSDSDADQYSNEYTGEGALIRRDAEFDGIENYTIAGDFSSGRELDKVYERQRQSIHGYEDKLVLDRIAGAKFKKELVGKDIEKDLAEVFPNYQTTEELNRLKSVIADPVVDERLSSILEGELSYLIDSGDSGFDSYDKLTEVYPEYFEQVKLKALAKLLESEGPINLMNYSSKEEMLEDLSYEMKYNPDIKDLINREMLLMKRKEFRAKDKLSPFDEFILELEGVK